MNCLAVTALLALAPAASAQTLNELPLDDGLVGAEYRMTVTLARGDPMPLIQAHKSKCEALGPAMPSCATRDTRPKRIQWWFDETAPHARYGVGVHGGNIEVDR